MTASAPRLEFARLLLAAGHRPAAESALRTVLAGTPDHGEALGLLGTLRLEQGAGDAEAVLACAVAADPASAETWHALGRAAWQDGRREEALRCGRRALRVGPTAEAAEFFSRMSRTVYNDAVTECAQGRRKEAVAALRALFDDPDAEVRIKASAQVHGMALQALSERRQREAAAMTPMRPDGTMPISAMRVRVEVSSACNLRCRHCPTGVAYGGVDRRLMKAALFERVLEDLKRLPHFQACVMYLGGEPLLHPRLAAMCRRVTEETGVERLHFNTNAMLLTEDTCAELAGSGVTRINVSIDGRSPEENDRLRRGAVYATVLEKLRMLLRHTRPAGIDVAVVNVQVRRPGDPEVAVVPGFLTRDLPGVPVVSMYAMRWPGWDTPEDEPSLAVTTSEERRAGLCLLPFSDMVVCANGDVTLCCYDLLGAEVLGNIAVNSLAEIWNGPKFRALRLAMAEGRRDGIPDVCRRCPVYTGEELVTDAADAGPVDAGGSPR